MEEPSGITIRRGTAADAAAAGGVVADVLLEHGLGFDPALDADILTPRAHYLTAGGAFFLAVDADGGVVGTAALMRTGAATGELRKLFLLPHVRGRGVGRLLLDAVLDAARARALRRVTLTTRERYGVAMRLYERYRFRYVGGAHQWRAGDPGLTYALDLDVLAAAACSGLAPRRRAEVVRL
ncbi:MAG TPA: GNAT family N-acetyltransferase [Mycobacteriales bacterium]|nr:GNAT family N-acetyltransferase [Mycobacteriales bacterium]